MATVLLLLSRGSALLPYIAALLSPKIWLVVSKALPLVTQLVKAYESDSTIAGRAKALLVIERTQALLAEDGFIISEGYDWILSALVELSLILLRRPAIEASKSTVVKHIKLV